MATRPRDSYYVTVKNEDASYGASDEKSWIVPCALVLTEFLKQQDDVQEKDCVMQDQEHVNFKGTVYDAIELLEWTRKTYVEFDKEIKKIWKALA